MVEGDDQITHFLALDEEELNTEDALDVFKFDPEYTENEHKYEEIKKDILGDESSEEEEGESEGEGDEAGEGAGAEEKKTTVIRDETSTTVTQLRRQIYLTIMSSVDYEECCHKLLKLRPGEQHERELSLMIIECCSQERTFNRFFALIGQRFCQIGKNWENHYGSLFQEQYENIHVLETNRIRNVAKFFAAIISADAIPWTCLSVIKLNENDTTSSSRIFVKILFQEFAANLGLKRLNDRLLEPHLEASFAGLFPKDNLRDTRFAINFFTSVGLGGLT